MRTERKRRNRGLAFFALMRMASVRQKVQLCHCIARFKIDRLCKTRCLASDWKSRIDAYGSSTTHCYQKPILWAKAARQIGEVAWHEYFPAVSLLDFDTEGRRSRSHLQQADGRHEAVSNFWDEIAAQPQHKDAICSFLQYICLC